MSSKQEHDIRKNAIYFFGQNNKYGEFSNWFHCEFEDPKVLPKFKFQNTEQYMMYCKAILFKDNIRAKLILQTSSPKLCKKYGRQVKNFDDKVWTKHCENIVFTGCLHKFTNNKRLKSLLLSTGDKLLVEASPYDRIWGIGLNKYNAIRTPMGHWRGQNKLGKCLMKVRDFIRNIK